MSEPGECDLEHQLLDRLRHALMYQREVQRVLLEALRLLEARREQ
jgi:hypothetical protein